MWSKLIVYFSAAATLAILGSLHMSGNLGDQIWGSSGEERVATLTDNDVNGDDVPVFEIDVALPVKERYAKVIEHFRSDMVAMENFFLAELNRQDTAYLKYIEDNLEKFKEHQPDTFAFAEAIAESLSKLQSNFTTSHALLVNSIVDFNSFCTSIVAANSTNVVHVRNLDFDAPALMQKLIYIQNFTNSSATTPQPVFMAPSIAGYYGVYTGYKPGHYSLSYNVRFGASLKTSEEVAIATGAETTTSDSENEGNSTERTASHLITGRKEEIWTNLKNEINPEYIAAQNFIQQVMLSEDNYEQAVERLKTRKFNTACYIIICNAEIQGEQNGGGKSPLGQGVVIVRSRDQTDHMTVLGGDHTEKQTDSNSSTSSDDWYILQTNMDVWKGTVHDPRHDAAVKYMSESKSKYHSGGEYLHQEALVNNVLRQPQVQTYYTIFAAGMNVQKNGENKLNVYKAKLA